MSTLTKAMIITSLCHQIGVNRKDAQNIVEQFFQTISQALENGQHVKLSGLGNYILRDKPAHVGRNLQTGEAIKIPPRRVVTFKPGKKLKLKMLEAQSAKPNK